MRVKKQVIHYSNFSRKYPWQLTTSWILIIKVFNLLDTMIGAIFVGAFSVALLGLWSLVIYNLFKYDEEPIDIFKPKETPTKDEKSNSMRRNRRQPVADDEDDEFQ